MSQLNDIVQKTLETAKSLGAQNAKVEMSRAQRLKIKWRQNKIEEMTSAGESALNVSLYVDGRFGSYRTSDLRADSIQSFLEKSIAMTRLLEEDPARQLADPERYKNRPSVDLERYDQKIADFTPNQAIERCKQLVAAYSKHDDHPIIDLNITCSAVQGESVMMTSNGFEGSDKITYAINSGVLYYADGEKKILGSDGTVALHLDDLRSPKDISDVAAKFANYKFGQKKLPSKNRTIVFYRDAAEDMVGRFINPLSGMSLVRKQSYFENKIGQQVASKLFDLHDNPLIVRGLGSRLYDDEGMSAKDATLFENGVLKQYLLGVYTANKLGLVPTSADTSNLILTPGKRSLEEMIADVKDGIYVFDIMGGNADETRGDFSHGIVGVAIENGKLTTPVSEMNITGNYLDMWKNLVEVANDPNPESSSRIPSLRIDNVSVSGA